MKIVAPSADVPEEYAQFSGIWKDGKWDGILCHQLAVEMIDAKGNAKLVYSWGTALRWRINQPGYQRLRGEIADGKLKTITMNRGKVTYWLKNPDTMSGKYVRNSTVYIELKKDVEP